MKNHRDRRAGARGGSEAAFEAGFQSLSQFNRVFRRIEGQAPSAYRDKLHGVVTSTLPFAA